MRFFKERRVPVAFVDLAQRPIAPAELRRFATRFGAPALLDESTRAYRDQGLAYMRMGDEEAFERVLREQALLRLPLVRAGNSVSIGVDEPAWRSLLTAER